MIRKIVIDPLTRISGFLKIEVEINNNKIINAMSSGLLYRGFEKILKGKPPLDAVYITERICGICSTAHSYVSTIALENALNITPDENSVNIRNIIHGCEFLQNHLRHFYLYTIPDYIKISGPPPIENLELKDLRLPQKENKIIAEDYLKAICYSRMAHEIISILGGKAPHNHGIIPGGATCSIDSMKVIRLKSIISEIKDFIDFNMIRDMGIIEKYYEDYFNKGTGYGNLLSYGVFNNFKDSSLIYTKPGVMIDNVYEIFEQNKITENVRYSWYEPSNDTIYPNESEDTNLSKPEAYSFIKAPRYKGKAMEVGPLARMILSRNYSYRVSCLDRIKARVLEAKKIAFIVSSLINTLSQYTASVPHIDMPVTAEGYGFSDTTRGALAHFISIKNKVIENYSIITPSGWNVSPMDNNGTLGVIEKALIGTEIYDIEHPVEIGRIVRSFDPCISCAVHSLSNVNSLNFTIL